MNRSYVLKKLIKANKEVIKDLEYERLQTMKMSLLHFFNAKMYLHSEAMKLATTVYKELDKIDFVEQLRDKLSIERGMLLAEI